MTEPAAAAPRTSVLGSALRFLVVGGLSFVVDFGALVLLHGVLSLPLWFATAVAFAASFVVNFGLNRTWTFRAGSGAAGGQVVRFVILVGANLVLTVLIVTGLTALGLDYRWSKVIATAVITVINFGALRLWVFRTGHLAV